MKFIVFGHSWAGGMKQTPKEILERICADKPIEIKDDNPKSGVCYSINITPDELMIMADCSEFDMLITGSSFPKLLAFDAPGRRFTQR